MADVLGDRLVLDQTSSHSSSRPVTPGLSSDSTLQRVHVPELNSVAEIGQAQSRYQRCVPAAARAVTSILMFAAT